MQQRLRLRRPADFARMRREGRTYRHRALLVSVAPNNLPHNRYGFITSKYLGSAVTRNRTKRLMREAVRLLHPSILPGYDVVVIARQPVVGQPFSYVERIVKQLVTQAALLAEGDA